MLGRPGQFNSDQFKFDFSGAEKNTGAGTPEQEIKIELHERDECQSCGNIFESESSCFQCHGNKTKIKWRTKQQPKTH